MFLFKLFSTLLVCMIQKTISQDQNMVQIPTKEFVLHSGKAHFSENKNNLRSSLPSTYFFTKPNGVITTYNVMENACQYPNDMYQVEGYLRVAISEEDWKNGKNCGKCFKLIGKGSGIGTVPFEGEYNAIVTNICPECPRGHFDILQEGNGIWDIEYYEQECQHLDYKNAQFKTMGEAQNYTLRFQIINTKSPVEYVCFTENTTICLEKTWDNYWVYYDPTALGDSIWKYPIHIQYGMEDGKEALGSIYITNEYQDL